MNIQKNNGFITLTVIFEAMSLNRDEGMGNIQSLHLLNRGNGEVYTYMSRQALTYAIRKMLIESKVWPSTPVKKDGGVIQYNGSIKENPEIDLFGFMTTVEGKGKNTQKGDKEQKGENAENESTKTRPACISITNAISMEKYASDIAFYANHELNTRYMKQEKEGPSPMPYNKQEHKSIYKYSVVIDLNRVGADDETDESLITEFEKANRINSFLDAISVLGHQISAKRESLVPLFIVATHIKYGSPLFHNYIETTNENISMINSKLFLKGINHAKTILKQDERITWGILEGSGDIHLRIDSEKDVSAQKAVMENNLSDGNDLSNFQKGTPFEAIEEVKNWVNYIYGVKEGAK